MSEWVGGMNELVDDCGGNERVSKRLSVDGQNLGAVLLLRLQTPTTRQCISWLVFKLGTMKPVNTWKFFLETGGPPSGPGGHVIVLRHRECDVITPRRREQRVGQSEPCLRCCYRSRRRLFHCVAGCFPGLSVREKALGTRVDFKGKQLFLTNGSARGQTRMAVHYTRGLKKSGPSWCRLFSGSAIFWFVTYVTGRRCMRSMTVLKGGGMILM